MSSNLNKRVKKSQAPSTMVVSSNDLVHAKYSMSLWQKRLFAYAVSRLRREDREFSWQRIYYSDLIAYFEASGGKKAYDAIREAPAHLDMTIEVPYRDESKHLRYAFLKILSGYTIPADEGERNQYVDLKFNDDLRPHLLALKERFLGYDLINVKRLRSVYSIRVYELLKSHEYQRTVEFEVDYLRELLQLQDTYKLYADFRRNVIDKAQNDMREACDIVFEYTEVKKANRVISLCFVILPNEKNQPASQPALPKVSAKNLNPAATAGVGEGRDVVSEGIYTELETLVVQSWGVSPASFANVVKQHSEDEIRQAVRVTKRKVATGELGNKAGFFMAAVRSGFTDEEEAKANKKKKLEEKNAQLAALRAESERLAEALRKDVFARIRVLTETVPQATERAVEAVRASMHPLVRSKVATLGPTATVEDFRRDEYLREKVIEEIIRQNSLEFDPLYREHQEKQQQISAEIGRVQGL